MVVTALPRESRTGAFAEAVPSQRAVAAARTEIVGSQKPDRVRDLRANGIAPADR